MIDRLKARGTTFLLPALEEAERTLAESGASIKHVVILTDGETGGTAAMYYDLVSSMHHDGGVTISTIAVGTRGQRALLEAISKYGGGGFYQTDSASRPAGAFPRGRQAARRRARRWSRRVRAAQRTRPIRCSRNSPGGNCRR